MTLYTTELEMVGTPARTVLSEYAHRKISRSPLIERIRKVTEAYDNDIAIPLPEMSAVEATPVANLITAGIDQHAMRVADVLPDVQCPPVKPGKTTSMEKAASRRRACYGYWDQNEYELITPKRARWLVAYATSPVLIRPDRKIRGPRWELQKPQNTYPSADDTMRPDNVILAFTRTVRWLRDNYPHLPLNSVQYAGGKYETTRGLKDDDAVEIVQWRDAHETVTLVTGYGYCVDDGMTREAEYGINGARIINLTAGDPSTGQSWYAELGRIPNLTGLPQVITPGRITLDSLRGQFDDAIGLYGMQAVLASMEVNAIANTIWPDQWLVPGGPGEVPSIITHANGRAGKIGQISGGTINTVNQQAGMQTQGAIDRLERAIRLQASVPADFSGESPSNVRTARRGAAVLGAAVDYTISEHQKILARSMQHELELAAAVDTAYFGNDKKSYYVKWKGATGRLDYTPSDIWGDDRTIHVSYAKAGADSEQLTVETGQLVGMGVMSKDTAMRRLPDIDDPDFERGQIVSESLDAALLSSLQQGAASGQLAVMDIAAIKQKISEGLDLEAAILEQQKEAQARQAQQVEASAPEAQPGLSAPGAGAEAQASIPEPTANVQNLADLLRNLRTPAAQVGAA